jgi:hypothetical protein
VAGPRSQAEIERFVRDTLGCGCPDEVFRSIRVERATVPGAAIAGARPVTRLVLGDRLLVYALETDTGTLLPELVRALALAGRSERDTRRLNRFRLALATGHAGPPTAELEAAFSTVAGSDERMHMHLLEPGQLPDSLVTGMRGAGRTPSTPA